MTPDTPVAIIAQKMGMMKKVFLYTLGCRVNQYDTETIRTDFERLGFAPVSDIREADVCVVNTCSVTAESDRKCRSQIRRLHRLNPRAFFVAAGCYAQGSPEELREMPEVDLVVGTRSHDRLTGEVLQAMGLACPEEEIDPDRAYLTTFSEHTRAFVKIEDGCNQMCSYCRIPFYRGRARSRPSEEVIQEIGQLTEKGYHEVVLCGIQLGAFGRDSGESFPKLLERIDALPGLERFRLSSIEPDDVTSDLIEPLTSLPKLAHHLHLPLQSGDDRVLQRMRRRYTFADYRSLVECLRETDAEYAVSGDIMVGFPGETEEAFENSLRAIEAVGFCRLHIFRFSPRPGTLAAKFEDRVPKEEIDRRRVRIGETTKEVVDRVRRRQIGRTLTVLMEEPGDKPDSAVGFAENYLRVKAMGVDESLIGRLVRVRIEDMDEKNLLGESV